MELSETEFELICYDNIAAEKQLLYKELEKHIYLGQWEFVRAFVFTILSDDSEEEHIKQILRKVAIKPEIARIRDPVTSTSHLSWLACQLLQQISLSEIGSLKKYAEFCMMLHDLLPEAQLSIIEELQNWYSDALEKMNGCKEVTNFSPACCTFLQSALLQNPSSISILMEKLIISRKSFQSTNAQIYAIYLQSILHCIKQIEGNIDISLPISAEKRITSVKKALCLFNVFPESEEVQYEPEVEKVLIDRLCDLVKLCTAKVIDTTEIYSALFTRKSPHLLQMFSVEDDRLFSQTVHCQSKEIQSSSSNFSTITSREMWFREVYLQCINYKTHFLNIIMDDATKYLLEGKSEEAWNVIVNPLLYRLQPLIIILAWQSCSSDRSASNVLDVIKSWKSVENTDPVFLQIFQKLQYNLHITDWCVEKLRLQNLGCSESVLLSRRRNIFNRLLSQSPLQILHKTIGLRNVSYTDMLSLLKFSKGEDGESGSENLLMLSNSMVFHGYLSIMHVMDAIGACCKIEHTSALKMDDKTNVENWDINNWHRQVKIQENKLPLDIIDIEVSEDNCAASQVQIDELSLDAFIDKYGFQLAYSHFVIEQLQKAKSELNQIYPVEFRIEILENIFSLLFVTGNDFQDNDGNNFESEDYGIGENQDNIKSDQVISKQSSSSTNCGISRSGFLCNELIVRDLLTILKEAHLDSSSAAYMMLAEKKSANQNEKETEQQSENLSSSLSFIKSSITKFTLQQRMSRLLKYINEGQWRFELVVSELVPREFGMCGNYFCKKSKQASFIPQQRVRMNDKESEHFSSSSGQEDGKSKRRAYKHGTHHTSLGVPDFQEAGFIHYMLASPSDLLCHSLWRQNYNQSKQVIQIFNLQSTSDATEVYFSENYAMLVKYLESLKTKQRLFARHGNSYLDSKDDSTKRPSIAQNLTTVGVSALAEAAAAGVQPTTITSLVDKMLNSAQYSIIPDFAELKEKKIISNLLAECKELHGIVLADCAYTASTTIDIESMLLQMSMKRLNYSVLTTDYSIGDIKRKSLHSIKGIVKIIEQNYALSQEIDKYLQTETHDFPSFFVPETACCRNLMTLLGSLNHKTYREQIGAWKKFIDQMNEVEMLLQQDMEEAKNDTKTSEVQNNLHQSFQELSKICSVNLRFLTTEVIPNKGHKYLNYLKAMYDHISHVSRALAKCKSHSYSKDKVSCTSYFSVLRESPSDVLSKMMLQNGIPPTKLESFAAQMKVDLVHIITQNCFPYVSSSSLNIVSSMEPVVSEADVHSRPCIILNSSGNTWNEVHHPELVVRRLLSDIVSLMHEVCIAADSPGILTMPTAICLLKEPRLKNWMACATEIAHIDICLLKSREEKLAFFGNLCNVMWIHAIFRELDLAAYSRNNALPHLKSILKNQAFHLPMMSPNVIERLVNQKIYAYQIGESHVLSLLDLRYHILHTGLLYPTHVTLPALSHLFDFSDDNEIVVGVEPRLLFTICEGFVSSPKLQVLYPETVISQLDDAMRDYLCFHVETNCNEEKVLLPQLLNWYSQDFAGDDDNDWSRANYEGLVTLVSSYVRGNMQDDLQSLLSLGSIHGFSEYIDDSGKKMLPFSVEFKPFMPQFGIIFDYDSAKLENFINNDNLNIVEKPDYYQICQQTHIMQYLRNKCWMLSEFLGMMNCENSDEARTANEENKAKFSALKLTPETPLTRLLCHTREIWYKCAPTCVNSTDLVWIVAALTPYCYKSFIWNCLDACIRREDWQALFSCLLYAEHEDFSLDFRLFKDILLQHLASFIPGTLFHFLEPWSCALAISDTERKAKCILTNIAAWTGETCIKVLKACLSDERIVNYSELNDALVTKLEEISLYQKIIQVTSRVVKFDSPKVNINSWQDIAKLSSESPKILLEYIRSTEQYNLSIEWAKLHSVGTDAQQLTAEMNISWLLDQDPLKTIEAEQILQSLNGDTITSMCHSLMKTMSSCESKIFLVQYILKHLNFTEENEKEEFNNLFLGLKIMLAVKEVKRRQYEHLIYYPHLLLEQLLMNMEIDTVQKGLKLISNVSYAEDILPISKIDGLLEQYAEKALEIPIVEEVIASSSSDNSSTSALPATTEKFIMPLNVPKKENWIPDSQVRNCMVCQNQPFSMFNRRHHCRRCGRIVCKACSQHRVLVEGYDTALVRICDECYEQLYPGNAEEMLVSYSPSSLKHRLESSSAGQISPKYYGMPQREGNMRRKMCISTETQWLGKDETNNTYIREEFYYEQAPSVSLCLSILKLHSDLQKCSSFVLGLCNKLFNMLIPKVANTPNPEIDYALMISIIRSLLLNIKLKLSEAGIEDGAEYVDTYSTFLDLIKQLVNENCVHLLPEDSITSDVAIRKLRDALRKEEKMILALEVSAKYSLDTFGIWATWGKTFLEIGDWVAAREKFSHCLKKPKDRSQSQNESALLKDILNLLENATHQPAERNKSIMRSLSTLKDIQNGITGIDISTTFRHEKLAHQVLKECLYYLENYGYHLTYVSFYQRHGMICEAINYILKEMCNTETFIEGLFLPCAKSGMLYKLKTAISSQDSSLSKFRKYLIGTCKYLEKNYHYNLLYEVQLYMKDYIRAAMTNMLFFQEPAENYTEIAARLHHMFDAKKNLETYLKSREVSSHDSNVKKMEYLFKFPSDKVKRHIRKIDLQIKATKYFSEWESENNLEYPLSSSQNKEADVDGYAMPEVLPTLLGDSTAKNHVAAMMIINSKDLKQGLSMASEIIQEFQLSWSDVIGLTSSTLVKCSCWDKVPCLIECACKDYNFGNCEWDEIILNCIKTSVELSVENSEIERLISLISNNVIKIRAYILCGKLMSAYLLANKIKRTADIQEIMIAAKEKNQDRLSEICERWLQNNAEKPQN